MDIIRYYSLPNSTKLKLNNQNICSSPKISTPLCKILYMHLPTPCHEQVMIQGQLLSRV